MEKQSFLIYLDYKEQFELLSDEQLGKLIRYLMSYEETGEVPQISDGVVNMAFYFIKSQLDRDREKYNKKCEQNKENGKRGGRPKKRMDNKKTERFL